VNARAGPREPKYLLVKGSSGLGNRILCVLTGILYARLSRRRLLVDWSDPVYSEDGSNAFFTLFDCPSAGGMDELPDSDSVVPSIWRGHLRDSFQTVLRAYYRTPRGIAYGALERSHVIGRRSMVERLARHLSIDVMEAAYGEQVAVLWSYKDHIPRMKPLFHDEFAGLGHMSTPEIMTMLLAQDLLPGRRIQARVDAFNGAHPGGPTVGVHLRLSDRQTRVDAILAELDSLLRRVPDLRIFAATDNIEVKEQLERRYPGVLMTPHWYPPARVPLHKDPARPDRLENGIEALVDLYLLGGCDYLIADGSSSFARIAALLVSERGGSAVDVRAGPAPRSRVSRRIWRHARLPRMSR
jgi:hypothetical protein